MPPGEPLTPSPDRNQVGEFHFRLPLDRASEPQHEFRFPQIAIVQDGPASKWLPSGSQSMMAVVGSHDQWPRTL